MTTCQGDYAQYVVSKMVKWPEDIADRVATDSQLRQLIPLLPLYAGKICPDFNPQDYAFHLVVNGNEPFKNLPVLFSSANYVSSKVEALGIPAVSPAGQCQSYWIGSLLSSPAPTLRAKCLNNERWEYNQGDQTWYKTALGAVWTSGLTKTLISEVQNQTGSIRLSEIGKDTVTLGFGFNSLSVTQLELSGDESTYFLKDGTTWKWFSPNQLSWIDLKLNLSASKFAASYDGALAAIVTTSGQLKVLYCKPGDPAAKLADLPGGFVNVRYIAVLGQTIFVAEGKIIYSLRYGGLVPQKNFTIPSSSPVGDVFTGLWADDKTVWAGTTYGYYQSSDNGWSWVHSIGPVAVGPGLFVDDGFMFGATKATFKQDRLDPLKLYNSGRLTSAIRGTTQPWENWFELYGTDVSAPAFMYAGDRVVVSSNGLFIATQSDAGDVVLYFNAWNSLEVQKFCSQVGAAQTCGEGFVGYCRQINNVDPGCGCINLADEAERLFHLGSVTGPASTALRRITPCVSGRCQDSNRDAYPKTSIGKLCDVPLTICASMLINSDNASIGGNVNINTQCSNTETLPCNNNECPVGYKCSGQVCRMECDGKCPDPTFQCVNSLCMSASEVAAPKDFDWGLVLGIGCGALLLLGLIIFIVVKSKK